MILDEQTRGYCGYDLQDFMIWIGIGISWLQLADLKFVSGHHERRHLGN